MQTSLKTCAQTIALFFILIPTVFAHADAAGVTGGFVSGFFHPLLGLSLIHI